VQLVGNKNILS